MYGNKTVEEVLYNNALLCLQIWEHAYNRGVLWVRYGCNSKIRQLNDIYKIFLRHDVKCLTNRYVHAEEFSAISVTLLRNAASGLVDDKLIFGCEDDESVIAFCNGVRAGCLKSRKAQRSH